MLICWLESKCVWKNNIQYSDSYSQVPSILKEYIDPQFPHSLHQLIMKPIRKEEHTKTLKDHILTNFPEDVIQRGIIEMEWCDHKLIYCSRKMALK